MSCSLRPACTVCVFFLLLFAGARVEANSVTVAWDRNPEPDVAGYTLFYGTQSGQYSVSIQAGNVTQITLPSLPDGTYFFAVQAYNASGFASPLSGEIRADLGTGMSTGGCTTGDPFASLGGGTCYNGNWLPPGMALPGTTSPTPPTPASSGSSGGCTIPDPFTSLGGGTCYNGNWLPPGMSIPGSGTSNQPQPPGGCTTSDPYVSLGGGTCVDGNWVPPTIDWQACATPDPFVSVAGLIGVCTNGNWVPVEGIGGTGSMHFFAADGVWGISADDGKTYVPVYALNPALQKEGQRVALKGVPRTDLTSGVGIMIEIVTIVVNP